MLFKRKPREGEPVSGPAPPPPPGVGPAALRDDLGLHQLWYLEQRLKDELARASRGAVLFSLAAWQPRLLPGDQPDPEIMRRAATFIAGRLRSYDVAARVDEQRFVALLLDADYHQAATVAFRIKADIQVTIPGSGKWRAGVSTFGRDGVEGDGLIHTAFRRLDEEAAAA